MKRIEQTIYLKYIFFLTGLKFLHRQAYFPNVHNSFGRENKKIKVSGTSRNNFIEINQIYQKRIHTYNVEWGTKSYFETESIDISDSNDEGSDKAGSITPDIEAVSDTSQPPVKPTPAKVTKAERPSWKFHKKSSTE